ncbi:MAG: hypothetical protein Q8S53_11745 [Brevundimonas sp.]|uniref:hypothetical protein n=1 Tax=Brevundimonas sp. TaxID=1871086 RepID=UPI002732C30F|nr:hypothetical protein [Brevundimonas sp.]MDP3379030.1 hypothetical protein [Brevundimonas sp.]
MRLLPLIVGLIFMAAPERVWACSLTEEAFSPTNFELVGEADAIVIGTAISGEPMGADGMGGVRFRIDGSLKGEGPPIEFIDGFSFIGSVPPVPPGNITDATGAGGSCVRVGFELGRPYVLFLALGDDGQWRRTRYAFSRDAEDYTGPDSLWVRAITLYVDVQRNPDRLVQREVLASMIPELEGRNATDADRVLAADIRYHLQSLSPLSPTVVLIDAYKALDRGETPGFITGPYDAPERQKEQILKYLVLGDHREAVAFFESILSDPPPGRAVGWAIRFLVKNGELRRAFEVIESDVYPRLGGLPDATAEALARDISRAMYGEWQYPEPDVRPWEQDPYIRARWPEMALSLYWDFSRRGSRLGRVDSAIEALRPADYRDRPEVTLALAHAYDPEVEAWAIGEVDRLLPTADWLDDEDPLWFPLQVLVFASGQERDAALNKAFCSSDSGRIMVVGQLGVYGDSLDDELLIGMLVSEGLSDDQREGILAGLIVNEGSNNKRRNSLLRTDLIDEVIGPIIRGEPVTRYGRPIAPLVCPTA